MKPVLVVAHFQEVANIAQWEDEQIEYFKEKVTEEGKQEDLKKGKAPAQVFYFSLWNTMKLSNRKSNTPFSQNYPFHLNT